MAAPAPILVVFSIGGLRVADNAALHWAAEQAESPVIPVFLWTPAEDHPWEPGAASRWWLHFSLESLSADLRKLGARLVIRQGSHTAELLDGLVRETGAAAIAMRSPLAPREVERYAAIGPALAPHGVEVRTFNLGLLGDPAEIKRQTPFTVYTAYWRAARQQMEPRRLFPRPKHLRAPDRWPASDRIDDLRLLPRLDWAGGLRTAWQPGEQHAQAGLSRFAAHTLSRYAADRDKPGADHTSRLSPYIHFGELSPRQVLHAIERHQPGTAVEKLTNELGWREFAHYLLHHFPTLPERSLDETFDAIEWRHDRADLRAWQRGRTGYPLVDAGMRQLWQTGWMHNRVRMVVASFLVKDLLQPWQVGARWFWDTLVDADLANNTIGWQWAAGSAADAAPFIRVFNPTLQAERFDPDGEYIRRWVPGLANVAAPQVLRPQPAPSPDSYPAPIVDHAIARKAALAAFGARR